MDERQLFNQLIGPYIRKKREEQGKTLEELAEDVNLDDKHIGKLENGKKTPNLYTFYKLNRVLDFHVDELFQEIEKTLKENNRD